VLAKASFSANVTGRGSLAETLFQPFRSRRSGSSQLRTTEQDGRPTDLAPAVTAGGYGRGRTLALAFPIVGAGASEFTGWGDRDNEYYARFWRNAIYWLTENSFIGRRRLAASTDKRFYQPGEQVVATAVAYNEAADPTSEYRIVAMIEPQSLDVDSDYAPVRWPSGVERTSGVEGPMIMWGEEFEIPVRKAADGQSSYALELELADAQNLGDLSGGMRLEITAYEDYTQVDSTSLPLMVLYDPFEQQNPFPNHELLVSLAESTGGSVVDSSDELAELLQSVPVATGPSEVSRTPVWSNWWLLLGLIGLLTVDWSWRRALGLA
jgi:hypothetical protein